MKKTQPGTGWVSKPLRTRGPWSGQSLQGAIRGELEVACGSHLASAKWFLDMYTQDAKAKITK